MNIERNLGNMERVIRLSLGSLFLAWAFSQPYMNGIEWFVVAIASMLMLNGIFSRCYVWYVLDLNTCNSTDSNCQQSLGSN
ncbi:DUF2892 domain-containing protein [Oceanicoccus sp. KOV_DT_Chl]|uniref:YgaP family membrane protein n=1 Tax=Oceanicoccus sp. KOV_DT_Chl TaxID=1904639 RepID=UPI00135838FE|nr:DUF2892 domain-containing protein [Oceanicoccus sp. KOV_DT_Chl]